jgi:hypothetical protein
MATESALFGSFLLDRPVPSTRTLEASVAGTFAGAQQLLGQQIAQAAGRFDGPCPRSERLRPGQQSVCLLAAGSHFDRGQLLLIAANGHRCMG